MIKLAVCEFDYLELDYIKKAIHNQKKIEEEKAYQNGFNYKYFETIQEILDEIIKKCEQEQNTFYPTKNMA